MPAFDRVPGTSSVLDTPPPSPQGTAQAGPTGALPSMSGLAQPIQVPSGQLPPEVISGAIDAAAECGNTLDALAQVAPDLAMDFQMVKDMLQRVMGKLLVAGSGGGMNRTGTGSNFPGGGFGTPGPSA